MDERKITIGSPKPLTIIVGDSVQMNEEDLRREAEQAALDRRAAFMNAPEISRAGMGLKGIIEDNPTNSAVPYTGGLIPSDPGMPSATGLQMQAMASVTMDPWELGQILMENVRDPETGQKLIGVVQTPEGEFFAVRKVLDPETKEQTGERIYSLNKPGASWQDAITFLGIGGAAYLAGGPATAPGRIAAAAGIQTGIQGSQAALGGEFNEGEVLADTLVQGAFDVAPMAYRAATRPRQSGDAAATKLDDKVAELAQASSDTSTPAQVIDSAKTLDLDPAILQAAEDLGVTDLPLSVASRDIRFQQIDQAIRSIPGSTASEAQILALRNLSDSSEVLITALGRGDRVGIGESVAATTRKTIQDLRTSANEVFYDVIEEYIPRATQVDTAPVMAYLEKRIFELGGDLNRLPTQERVLFKELTDPEGLPITYNYLDTLRKRIGTLKRGAERGTDNLTPAYELGNFEDALLETQSAAIEALDPQLLSDLGPTFPLVERFALARQMTAQRKTLEGNARQIFGKEYAKNIMPSITGQIKQIANRGELSTFRQQMELVPEDMRQGVIMTAIDDIFRSKARGDSGINMAGYANWYKSLKDSPAAFAEVTQYLSPESLKFMDDLAVVTTDWSGATRNLVMNGRIESFLKRVDMKGGFLDRLTNLDRSGVTRMASQIARAGSEAGPDTLTRVGDLLNDNVFRTLAMKYMKGEPTKNVFEALTTHKAFQTWFAPLPAESKKKILGKGLMNYLTGDEGSERAREINQRYAPTAIPVGI